MIITRDDWDHGSNLDVGTTAEALTTTSFKCAKSILIKADAGNTGIVYVGQSDVTAGDTAATDGIPLAAGEALELEVSDISNIYVIASVTAQKVYWIAV